MIWLKQIQSISFDGCKTTKVSQDCVIRLITFPPFKRAQTKKTKTKKKKTTWISSTPKCTECCSKALYSQRIFYTTFNCRKTLPVFHLCDFYWREYVSGTLLRLAALKHHSEKRITPFVSHKYTNFEPYLHFVVLLRVVRPILEYKFPFIRIILVILKEKNKIGLKIWLKVHQRGWIFTQS